MMIEKRVLDEYSSCRAQHDEYITRCYCSKIDIRGYVAAEKQ